jgi:hypothetical protein
LFIVGITDLVSISSPEEISQYHWGSQGTSSPAPACPILPNHRLTNQPAPIRLFLFGTLAFYSYTFSDSSPIYTHSQKTYSASAWGEGLKNRVVFTFAFLEMVTWFWVFVTLREERSQFAMRIAERRAAEDDRL